MRGYVEQRACDTANSILARKIANKVRNVLKIAGLDNAGVVITGRQGFPDLRGRVGHLIELTHVMWPVKCQSV